MKKIIIIVVIIAVAAAAAGYLLGWFTPPTAGKTTIGTPMPVATTQPPATQPTPPTQPATTAQPATTTTAPRPAPTSTATPTTATGPVPTASTTTTTVPFVKFNFVISSITGSGFTRIVNAQVSNLGNEDAHNVYGVVQVTQGGSVVNINGQSSLTVQIGTLPAGTMTNIQQSISFSLIDGLKIQSNGATFTVTIHSDEATETFTQFYQP